MDTPQQSGRRLGRRSLVTGGLALAGVGALELAPGGDAGTALAQPARVEADACVVGAGYAGLTAAYRLMQAGRTVVVLEARDRVGGRVWTEYLPDGTWLDYGG